MHDASGVNTTAALSAETARQAIGAAVAGVPIGDDPELVVLPLSDGYHLAYRGRAMVDIAPSVVFVDAMNGRELEHYSEFINEVGTGTGTYGDTKKVSDTAIGGAFSADDKLRPTEITTYDMKGNLARTTVLFASAGSPSASDIATSSTQTWTDATVVDAHTYAGMYYDYLFTRFNRHGVDDRDLRIALFTHPVSLGNISRALPSVLQTYYINAEYCGSCGPNGRGAVEFGEGAPRDFYAPGVEVKPFSAAFDVVAHELTHAVTASSAGLNSFAYSEAAALNEGFSDIFGVSTAFFYEPPGDAPLHASYLEGRDLTVPAGAAGLARSMSDPQSTSDPDHYSQRIVGYDPQYNSTILSHAFYLAIEGGANRTSGLAVQGVGAVNREQIEKVFFRALTSLLPSNSTFALTRDATIQSARDLYGDGSAVERAVTQAWDAVGVQDRTLPTATMLPNPAAMSLPACSSSLTPPTWLVDITVSAGASTFRVSSWTFDYYDHAGKLKESDLLSPTTFAQLFNQCGPGDSTVVAQSDVCAAMCLGLLGDKSGSAQMTVSATDTTGRALTFTTGRVILR